MRKKFLTISKIVFFMFLLVITVRFVSSILVDKTSIKRYYDFYNDDTELDVLLSGSSHMLNSILPMELYEKYGITSYNIGNPTESIPTSYWVIRNAIKYRKPKIVILEVYYDGWGEKIREADKPFLHYFFDSAPLSIDKILAMKDLVGLNNSLEYLFNLSFYNSRWQNLSKDDFSFDYLTEKGALSLIEYTTFDYNYSDYEFDDERITLSDISEEYLSKLKKLCDENGIELILFQAPFPANKNEISTSIEYDNFAKKNEIHFYNMLKSDEIDYGIYMANRGHLNIYGAKKVTDIVGDFLIKEYGNIIKSKNIKRWDDDLEEYKDFNKNRLNNTKKIDEIVLLSLVLNYDMKLSINNASINDVDIVNNFVKRDLIKVVNEKCDDNMCLSIYNGKKVIKVYKGYKDGNFIN